jgi:hypothetical protein
MPNRAVAASLALMFGAAYASAAAAAPSAEIREAAARVTVLPEARTDIDVVLIKANARLPIWISKVGDKVVIHGDVGHMITNCAGGWTGKPTVNVWMRGRFAYDDLPRLLIRTPLDVRVSAGDAVFGAIGHARNVDLGNHGCGDWTVADVDGLMHLGVAGSGDVRTGSAGTATIGIAGSGDVATRTVRDGLGANIAGSGSLTAAAVNGSMSVHVAGSGDVKVRAGQVTKMSVSVGGSGDVRFGGVAGSLEANVAGSGDVSVAHVTGPVIKHVAGSGDVDVGR